jgi:hypothetical protein
MKIISAWYTTKGGRRKSKEIMVSDEDYKLVSQYNWIWRDGYAFTLIGRTYYSLHRMVMNAPPKDPVIIDHINGDHANCTRENLRRANRFQNQQNRKTNKDNTLPKGIRLLPSGKYNVRLQAYNKRKVIGTFDTLEEAINERNRVAKHWHGEFFNPSHPIENHD